MDIKVKRELVKNKIFEKKMMQFNLHDKIMKKEIKVSSLNTKPYILENYINL